MSDYGVITEQGFPAGQFGFSEIDKKSQEKLTEDAKRETGKSSGKKE